MDEIQDQIIDRCCDREGSNSGFMVDADPSSLPYNKETYKIIYKQSIQKYPDDFQKEIDEYVNQFIRDVKLGVKSKKTKQFWLENIQK